MITLQCDEWPKMTVYRMKFHSLYIQVLDLQTEQLRHRLNHANAVLGLVLMNIRVLSSESPGNFSPVSQLVNLENLKHRSVFPKGPTHHCDSSSTQCEVAALYKVPRSARRLLAMAVSEQEQLRKVSPLTLWLRA